LHIKILVCNVFYFNKNTFLDLEHKYLETKSKLKKTLQHNERYNVQIQKVGFYSVYLNYLTQL